MKLSGHMIVKNCVKYDFPFLESCLSVLPICDEFVFVEGYSDDNTYELLLEFQEKHPKVRIIRHPWEKKHFSVLSDLTNVAIENCRGEYHYQIQADECLHERYHHHFRAMVERGGFTYAEFAIKHFYGSFSRTYKPGVFYDSFLRLAKTSAYPFLRSYDDAMSLGCPNSNPNRYKGEKALHIVVHHYGYVRKPKALIDKQDEVTKWWGIQERDPVFQQGLDQGWVDWSVKHTADKLDDYTDTHPAPLLDWISARENMVANGSLE